MKIKELKEEQKPREKALRFGIHTLTNMELLALVIRSGNAQFSVLEISEAILNISNSLGELSNLSLQELMRIEGIKEAKALPILACFELGKRISFENVKENISIDCPKNLSIWLNKQIGFINQEHFLVLFLDIQHQIMDYKTLFVGTVNQSVVHPREIFRLAMKIGCAKILCAHNHPSGKCQPSQSDIIITKKIVEVGEMVGIPLLDHIIVGKNNYISFREERIILLKS